MDHKEIKKLCDLLRKSGVEYFKTPEIELKLREAAPTKRRRGKAQAEDPLVDGQYTQEDYLFWSSTSPGAN